MNLTDWFSKKHKIIENFLSHLLSLSIASKILVIFFMYINFFEQHDSGLYFFPNIILMFSFSHQNALQFDDFFSTRKSRFWFIFVVLFSALFVELGLPALARPTSFSMCKAATCNNNRETKTATAAAWVPHTVHYGHLPSKKVHYLFLVSKSP